MVQLSAEMRIKAEAKQVSRGSNCLKKRESRMRQLLQETEEDRAVVHAEGRRIAHGIEKPPRTADSLIAAALNAHPGTDNMHVLSTVSSLSRRHREAFLSSLYSSVHIRTQPPASDRQSAIGPWQAEPSENGGVAYRTGLKISGVGVGEACRSLG